MVKKGVVVGILLFVVVIGIVWYLSTRPRYVTYSDEPKDWVEKVGVVSEVNVEEITKGSGFVDSAGVQMRGTIETVFDYEGFYKGNYFRREFADENGRVLMRIAENMNPNDGVIEGFIVERMENDSLVAYIFLDGDWKQKVGKTNIFWGALYEREKAFEFKELPNGVYFDKIVDDKSRFDNNFAIHSGGVIVGDFTRENTKNATAIRLV